MAQFLSILKSISDNHHRDADFNANIKKILKHFQDQIKQTLSNEKIFRIFESNKLIVLFLLKNGIIDFTETIYKELINNIEANGNRYCHFFYPELEKLKGAKAMKSIKDEILSIDPTAFDNFESKRQEGENDSYICLLIRNDSVEEFIAFVQRQNISVCSEIRQSIFETNSFLIENKNTSLIEYSAFFGSF